MYICTVIHYIHSVRDVGPVSDDMDAAGNIGGLDSQFQYQSSHQGQETATD